MKLKVRAPGCPDFEIELEPTATVADAKIEATCGCDVDPDSMKLICRGRVLRDGETLEASGVNGADALHVARGRPATSGGAAPAPLASSAAPAQSLEGIALGGAKASQAQAAAPGVESPPTISVVVRGPGGLDATLAVSPSESVAAVRARAASLCGLPPDHVHLVHRGRILNRDGAQLAESAIADGDVVRVAKRAVQDDAAAAAAQVPAGTVDASSAVAGSPMPMAWGSGPDTLAALLGRHDAEALNTFAAGLAQARPAARNAAPAPLEVRLPREVRAMEAEVRRLIARRQREEATRGGAAGPGQWQEPAEDADEEDPELLDHIARIMAEARARGAPVPHAAQFVDQRLARARNARALGERLEREASGLQPELEDALAAAEQTVAAAARAPRRLGGVPRDGLSQ